MHKRLTLGWRSWIAAVCIGFGSMGSGARVLAQQPTASVDGPVLQSEADVTFARLATLPFQRHYGFEQTRRLRDRNGAFVALDERLEVAGTGTNTSPFLLTFIGVEGQAANSVEMARWDWKYRTYAALLYDYGAFRVHDAALAASNYTIHHFGLGRRADREVRRVVVFPRRLDKSIWLIDLDVETGLLLYSAEYDSQIRLVGELAVTRVLAPAELTPSIPALQSRLLLTRFADLGSALATFAGGTAPIAPEIGKITPEYSIVRVHVAMDPLNGERSLVLTYSDGVDTFFVLQTPGRPNPLDLSPSAIAALGAKKPQTIAYYDDPSLRTYWFGDSGVCFEVTGRGTALRLRDAAVSIYRQSLSR